MRAADFPCRGMRWVGALALAVLAASLAGPATAQPGSVVLSSPSSSQTFAPGDQIAVGGVVVQSDGTPIGNETVTVQLLDSRNVSLQTRVATTNPATGRFLLAFPIPQDAPSGTYSITVRAADPEITIAIVTIRVAAPAPPDVPVYLWAVVPIVGVLAAVGGGLLLWRWTLRRPGGPSFGPPKP